MSQKVSVVLDLLDWGQVVASMSGWKADADHSIQEEIKKQVTVASFSFNPHVRSGPTGTGPTGRSTQDCPPGTVPVAKRFLSDIAALSCIYGVTLSHQDGHGAFIVKDWDQRNLDWLEAASIEVKTATPKLDAMKDALSSVLESYLKQRREAAGAGLSDLPVRQHVHDALEYVVEKCRHYLALYPTGVQRTEIVKEIMSKSLVALSSLDASSGGPAEPGHTDNEEKTFVLTVYYDLSGEVQYHAVAETDFADLKVHEDSVLRRFYIKGKIEREEGGDCL